MALHTSNTLLSEATIDRHARFRALPVWARLVAAIFVMLLVIWSLLIYLSYAERRDGSIEQARDFAESVNQITVATLTGMMMTNVIKDRAVFLDRLRNSNNINELRVVRGSRVDAQFGAGQDADTKPSAEEKAVMDGGAPQFSMNEEEGYLRAIFPILAKENYLGKNCLTCHHAKEGDVLGAVT
ncbi:MAG TPA: hypothetical protein VLN59_14165, partial [Burkholderiales bacterium]|nr:hypothetical protein [Burkholderiales bacterium]